jgi:hypothetical protein
MGEASTGLRGASYHRAGSLGQLELGDNILRKFRRRSDMRRVGACASWVADIEATLPGAMLWPSTPRDSNYLASTYLDASATAGVKPSNSVSASSHPIFCPRTQIA